VQDRENWKKHRGTPVLRHTLEPRQVPEKPTEKKCKQCTVRGSRKRKKPPGPTLGKKNTWQAREHYGRKKTRSLPGIRISSGEDSPSGREDFEREKGRPESGKNTKGRWGFWNEHTKPRPIPQKPRGRRPGPIT